MNVHAPEKKSLVEKLLSIIEQSRPSDRLILRVLFFIIVFSGIWAAYDLNEKYSQSTPIHGGVLHEGIIGTPRFVNPALASTRADQDMTSLIYSGLMKLDAEGELVPELAESVTLSEDGLTYNVVLRNDIYFHDGQQITSEDVEYTVLLIQDPDLKSPLRGNWSDVVVEIISDTELNIVITEPYAPFIENLLVGIMPRHLWGNLPIEQLPFSQLNSEPVGSGPFTIAAAHRDASGLIDGYTLTAFRVNPQAPNIDTVELQFYATEDDLLEALDEGLIDATAYVSNEHIAEVLENKKLRLITEPLPRVFGVFLNTNRSVALRDDSARNALSAAINRDELIEKVLFAQGVPITTPTANLTSALESEEGQTATTSETLSAVDILEEGGWKKNNIGLLEKQLDGTTETLSVTIKTSNAPLFSAVADYVKESWEAIGVSVVVEQYEQTGLVQSVIRPRDFESLLFGIDMSRSQDLYPFWHSSQKDDPGLNIAQYTNLTVDTLLEDARTEQDVTERRRARLEAGEIIAQEKPAIFLFQPLMTYVVSKDFIIPPLANIARPSDRFSNTTNWYTDSDDLWPTFRQDI